MNEEQPVDSQHRHGHAIVIGGSISGLLAARALSEAFERITVFDRDELPRSPAARRGVPQSRQIHGLLARGREVLEQLFPGFSDDLAEAGARFGDLQSDLHWYQDGLLLKPGASGLIGAGASRPLIEHVVRTHVASLPGVTIVDRCDARGLTATADLRRITGVRLRVRAPGATEAVAYADLVVDATGRGSRSPVWLEDLGYGRPRAECIRVRATYMSQVYRHEPHHFNGRMGTACAAYPGTPRSGFALVQEAGRVVIMLGGYLGTQAPRDHDGMLAYARTLATQDYAEIIRTATPLAEPVKMQHPASIRRHYEELDRLPEGYLVLGDAMCSFNPVYGQGMAVAALQGLLLMDLLAETREELGRRFFNAAARLLDTPWGVVAGGDLRFPEAEGTRTARTEQFSEYLTRYRVAAHDDAELVTAFLRVTNMLDDPSALMTPEIVARVTAGWLKGREEDEARPRRVTAR
ncbi:squalene monooxygenase [Streptomyces glebosus]|uniref:squalene monooxygenase n=1 Tax=Streptomyces glebosus TaxID=249580 RepID=UPI00167D416E|nr:squalene monooxygenase [Streptomyces glebosus]